jgi:hypothetical protein
MHFGIYAYFKFWLQKYSVYSHITAAVERRPTDIEFLMIFYNITWFSCSFYDIMD